MKLRNGLEYELHVSPLGEEIRYKHKLVDDEGDGNMLVLYHTGFTDEQGEESPGYRLLEYRADNILAHIQGSPHYAQGNYEQCFIDAFQSLDEELEVLVKQINWEGIPLSAEYLWRTRYNTMVVLLRNKKELYVAGASHLHVLAIRGPDNVFFTSQDHIHQAIILRRSIYGGPDPMESAYANEYPRYLEMIGKTVKEHPQLYYFNSATLKGSDEFLLFQSDRIHLGTHFLGPGGLPRHLRVLIAKKGFTSAIDYLHVWGVDDTDAFMFALRLQNRKREHGDSSESYDNFLPF